MSESKPTPGPWTYGVRKNGTIWFSLGDSVKGPHWQADLNAREPDARLMMAAPDLLARLKVVAEWIDNWSPSFIYDDEWPAEKQAMKDAIAKAEGRS